MSFSPYSLSTILSYFKFSNQTSPFKAIQIKVWMDPRLRILSASPASSKWALRVESIDEPLSTTTFTCTFLEEEPVESWDGFVFSIFLEMNADPEILAHSPNLSVSEIALHWEVTYFFDTNATVEGKTLPVRKTTLFKVIPDVPYTVIPIAKDSDLINTAVLSGRQTSTPMRIFTVSEGAQLRDVTSRCHCISAESRVLKTSPTCTSVYVDGSELRGISKIKVHVHYETWTTSTEFTVWYPKVPITVWISDPVLNAIKDWKVAMWRWLPRERQKKDARQFACINKFQQAEVS
ncbi:hypothetical protein AB6A40_009770 [Gnathostoma spinigerum]|uniref:Transmembrane protein family 132 fourth domain-containing protein n=1 Tax=Gnathostoma spinigerum TaxID=75299 RepID=A0ABD6ET83_9BILA